MEKPYEITTMEVYRKDSFRLSEIKQKMREKGMKANTKPDVIENLANFWEENN